MEIFILIVSALILGGLGAYMNRLRGMNENDVPVIFKSQVFRRILLGLIIGTSAWATTLFSLALAWIVPVVAIVSYFGIVIGHGSYFSRPNGPPNVDNELFAPLTRLIANPLNEQARFVGMALTGLTITIPVGLLGTYLGIFAITTFCLFGFLKAVVYFIGDGNTERAEYLWGWVLGVSMPQLAIIIL